MMQIKIVAAIIVLDQMERRNILTLNKIQFISITIFFSGSISTGRFLEFYKM